MDDATRSKRYERMAGQLKDLLAKTADRTARLATVAALLHHKQPHFFWTGFYLRRADTLVVGPYQGPLACPVLKAPKGVCWAGVLRRRTIIVPDVHAFPGHVACDSRSKSEIVVPLRDRRGRVWAVLDVDSARRAAFTQADRKGLEAIVALI